MTEAEGDAGLQAAAEQVVQRGAARSVGVAWRGGGREEWRWPAFAGRLTDKAALALLAEQTVERNAPVQEARGGTWQWSDPVHATGIRGAVVAIGTEMLTWQAGLLNLLAEAATLAAALTAERQRNARLQRWLTSGGRSMAAGNIVTGVAHRINNPLTTIIGESQLLQTEPLGPGVLASLSAIERAGQRIRVAVQSVLQFSYTDGAAEITDVNATVETALGLVTSQLEGAGVRLTARLAPNLPPVRADAAALTEAWVHLLVNAGQAIPRGETGDVRIATTLRDESILVTVSDSGPVTAPRRRTVQPFAPDMRGEMFLAWDILTRAGGQVSTASRPGTGTTIGVRLPLKQALK